jgi:hypothetical protein
MAIKVICDNCERELVEKTDKVATFGEPKGFGPDQHFTLRLSGTSTGDLIDMDLCYRCANKYLDVLTQPLPG